MSDQEAIVWLTRLKNSIKGKFEAELEITVALDVAIKSLEDDIAISTEVDNNKHGKSQN